MKRKSMKKKATKKTPTRKSKVDTGISQKKVQLERIESINVTLSIERLAGWTKLAIVKYLTEELERVGSGLGGDNGPRYNVETGPDTIVELDPASEPHWKQIDVEPIARKR